MVTLSNENISASLALCSGNSPVNGEFPSQRPVTWSFDIFFDVGLNKWLSKSRHVGVLRRHRAHYDASVMLLANETRHRTWEASNSTLMLDYECYDAPVRQWTHTNIYIYMESYPYIYRIIAHGCHVSSHYVYSSNQNNVVILFRSQHGYIVTVPYTQFTVCVIQPFVRITKADYPHPYIIIQQ